MWYSYNYNHSDKLIKYAMQKQASAIDELWKSLNDNGIAGKLGISDKGSFKQKMYQKDPDFVSSIGQHSSGHENASQIQQAYANFISGRVLAEEIGNARQQAQAEGRQPSVAELRAARRRANERLTEEGVFAKGLGMPSQIHVGRRGPLGKIRLKELEIPKETITDEEIQGMANQILAEEQERARAIAQQRFDNGEAPSPEPTVADMRAAVYNANKRLEEGLKFRVGKHGPLPQKFELNRNIENSKEYYEWKEKQKKKENLGLNDVLEVQPGNIAVPYPDNNPNDNFIPEEDVIEQREQENFDKDLDTIQKQANFPVKPPVHPPTCRCRIVQEGKTFKWQTAGDERVCDECNEYARQFNSLRNNNI